MSRTHMNSPRYTISMSRLTATETICLHDLWICLPFIILLNIIFFFKIGLMLLWRIASTNDKWFCFVLSNSMWFFFLLFKCMTNEQYIYAYIWFHVPLHWENNNINISMSNSSHSTTNNKQQWCTPLSIRDSGCYSGIAHVIEREQLHSCVRDHSVLGLCLLNRRLYVCVFMHCWCTLQGNSMNLDMTHYDAIPEYDIIRNWFIFFAEYERMIVYAFSIDGCQWFHITGITSIWPVEYNRFTQKVVRPTKRQQRFLTLRHDAAFWLQTNAATMQCIVRIDWLKTTDKEK